MNGIHDMGGMHGFEPIVRDDSEPLFHDAWERTVFAISQAARAQKLYPTDAHRFAMEQMPPAAYLAASYYERWLVGAEACLTAAGLLTRDEIDHRAALLRADPDAAPPRPDNPRLAELIVRRTPPPDPPPAGVAPRFAVGDRIRARNVHPTGHTRLPRYIRGKRGVIERVHGVFALPDAVAHGRGPAPQHVYGVCFDGRELWGDSAEPGQKLSIDLWEGYLEGSYES